MTRLPVACTLSEPDVAKRRAGLFADLTRRRQETRWMPEGITLRYRSEPGTLALCQCCPFLRLQLTVEPGGGPIWLELTGPPDTRDFLAHEIGDAGRMPDDHVRGE